MTEQEWATGSDPEPLLKSLYGTISERKTRLFAVGCCRRVGHLLDDPRSHQALDAAELIADEPCWVDAYKMRQPAEEAAWAATTLAGRKAARAVVTTLVERRYQVGCFGGYRAAQQPVTEAAYALEIARGTVAAVALSAAEADQGSVTEKERRGQADLLRELLGNPFRSVRVDASCRTWNGGLVTTLALAIYDERGFDRLPILGDALEEAGCADADIVGHCRSAEPHVRGCWVLDLLLEKE